MVHQRWREDEVEKFVNGEVMKRLAKSAYIVEGEIKKVITEKGLIDTGLYRDTIMFEMIPERLTAKIGSPIGDIKNPRENPPYPLYLELGTSRGIPPHACMRTGLARSKGRVEAVWK